MVRIDFSMVKVNVFMPWQSTMCHYCHLLIDNFKGKRSRRWQFIWFKNNMPCMPGQDSLISKHTYDIHSHPFESQFSRWIRNQENAGLNLMKLLLALPLRNLDAFVQSSLLNICLLESDFRSYLLNCPYRMIKVNKRIVNRLKWERNKSWVWHCFRTNRRPKLTRFR